MRRRRRRAERHAWRGAAEGEPSGYEVGAVPRTRPRPSASPSPGSTGPLKVTGSATYRRRVRPAPRQAHGAPSSAAPLRTAASRPSTPQRLDGRPGVIAVLTHRNAPRLAYRPPQSRRRPGRRRAAARAPGRPGEPSGPADRPRDRRYARAGHPRGAWCASPTHPSPRSPMWPASSRVPPTRTPGRGARRRGAAIPKERSRRRGQGRPDLRDPAREPQPDRDARHDRGLGRRSPDPVGQDAVGAQHGRRDRRRVRHSGGEHPRHLALRRRRLRLGRCAPGRM